MRKAVFTQGSTLRHILVMTSASTVGLVMLFTVDLVDMYFLSLLGQEELAAAIGFAGTLMFFLTSVSIGLQIAMGALVSRAEGAHRRDLAGQYCSNVLLFSALFAVLVCLPAWFYLNDLLAFLGARGKTLALATAYCNILLPSTPLLAVGMCAAAALRAIGDVRRSMYATIGGALVNAAMDPLFIFGLGWEIEGAAVASVLARIALVGIGFSALIRKHQLPTRITIKELRADLPAITNIAAPAMLTNLATPIGSSFVLKTMASFGDSAVAGAAILGRVSPVAFAAIFALSGSIGPIIGQNAGAGRYDRVRLTLLNAMMANVIYVVLVWLLLFSSSDWIVVLFDAQDDAAYLIRFYCQWLALGFMFNGMLFVSNASFNNLNAAHFATLLNFGRAVLGTIPLVYLFAGWYGAVGVMAGEIAGSVAFGMIGFALVLLHIGRLERNHQAVCCAPEEANDTAQWAYSSPRSQMGQQSVKQESEPVVDSERE